MEQTLISFQKTTICSVLITRGSVVVTRGSIVVTRGSVVVTRGSVVVTRGSIVVTRGSVVVTRGSVVVTRGSIVVTRGSIVISRGSVVNKEFLVPTIKLIINQKIKIKMKNKISLSKKQLKPKKVLVGDFMNPGKATRVAKGGVFISNQEIAANEGMLNSVNNQKLTDKERRLVKSESKKISNISSAEGKKHYAHNALMMKHGRNRNIMIMLAVSARIIKAKLAMPTNDEEFYRKSFNMQAAIFTNTLGFFTPAFSRLTIWANENIALDTALDAIENELPGGEALKVTAMANLNITLKLALNFVNDIVFLNQPQALSIIDAALMEPVGSGTIRKPAFAVKQTSESGSIKLISLAARKDGKLVPAAYEWEYSKDDGRTWTRLLITISASRIASGMELGVITLFRRRITTKEGTGVWAVSKPITPE